MWRTVLILGGLLALAACGPPPARTTTVRGGGSIGGVPVTTDLHAATGLRRGSVYSVARSTEGWRVLYDASAGSSAAVATRLCGLEGRAPATIRDERIASGHQVPGAKKILITCRG